MAALYGLGVDNVLVEIDGPEVPILDGSAAPFVEAIDQVGIASCERAAPLSQGPPARPRRRRARPSRNCARSTAPSASTSRSISTTPSSAASARRWTCPPPPSAARSPAPAPSASCGTSSGSGRPASPSAPRWRTPSRSATTASSTPRACAIADEFVRHKMLDAIGDLALAGLPLLGAYRSYCGGHRMNFAVLEALFADRAELRDRRGAARAARPAMPRSATASPVPAFAPDVTEAAMLLIPRHSAPRGPSAARSLRRFAAHRRLRSKRSAMRAWRYAHPHEVKSPHAIRITATSRARDSEGR